MKSYLPSQYINDNKFKIKHNYLIEQFSDYPEIFKKIEPLLADGQFTLGTYVDNCEKQFAERVGAKYAVGVGSGTDAIFLSLKAIGIKEGDEIITTPFTYIATIGAIVTSGAKPVFVDIKDDYNIDEEKIEKAITKRTKAIVPVHWTGRPCEMDRILEIAKGNNLRIIQDACHAIDSKYKDKNVVEYDNIACYSMHPLKNLNVWGDGGFITTNDDAFKRKVSLMRNHGLIDRDNAEFFAYNSRLDSLQAIVASHFLDKKITKVTEKRIENSLLLDKLLKNIPEIILNKREKYMKEVFHLYQITVEDRNNLQSFLMKNGIDAKIHYPVPMHLQPAAEYLKYKIGDLPNAERIANKTLSLPVHEFIKINEIEYMADQIKKFYKR